MSAALRQIVREAIDASGHRTIPFEYAFRFSLIGVPENVIGGTVTVSIESAFVAVSIGYGVIPDAAPVRFGAILPTTVPLLTTPASLSTILGQVIDSLAQAVDEKGIVANGAIGPKTAAVLTNGFRLNRLFADRALQKGATAPVGQILNELFESTSAPASQVQFLYSLRDEGTGREFQSEPILNIAGLGIADGDRPFRYFAQPITFAPRSTIRMEIREKSDVKGELHVVLHGYKVLGGKGTPTQVDTRPARRTRQG